MKLIGRRFLIKNMKKHNRYEIKDGYVLVYPQDRDDICTLIDYEWYEYFSKNDIYLYPKADRDNGYYWCFRDGKKSTVRIHSVICCLGCDHINGDKSDNRMSNLRKSTPHQNSCNRGVTKANLTGYKGVQKDKNKFCVQLRDKGKLLYFGSFNAPEEAARIYDLAALKYFGDFAWTNFPKENYTEKEINDICPSTMQNRKRKYEKKVSN